MGASVSMWFYRILSILSVHQKHHVCLQEVCNSRSRKITCLWHRRKHGKNWESSHPALKKNTPKVEDSLLRNGQKQKPQKPCPEDSEIQGVQSLRCQIVPSKGPWAARIFEGPGWSCKASSDWLFFISFPPKASHINAVNALAYHCFSLFLIVYHCVSLFIIVYHCLSLCIIVYRCVSLFIIFHRRQELHRTAKVGRMQCLRSRFDAELLIVPSAPSAPSAPYRPAHVEDLLGVAQ